MQSTCSRCRGVRGPAVGAFGGLGAEPRRATYLFVTRRIKSVCARSVPRLLQEFVVLGHIRTGQRLRFHLRSARGDVYEQLKRSADVSAMQAPDGAGAHFARRARLRRSHIRVLDLRSNRKGLGGSGSHENQRRGMARRRTPAAALSLAGTGSLAGAPCRAVGKPPSVAQAAKGFCTKVPVLVVEKRYTELGLLHHAGTTTTRLVPNLGSGSLNFTRRMTSSMRLFTGAVS